MNVIDLHDRPDLTTYIRRDLPGLGLLEFEFAEAGTVNKKGEVRKVDWRAYFFTPDGGKRTRFPSVTTLLAAIIPKEGVAPWSEARGIEGAVEAVRIGEIDPHDPASAQNAVAVVRALRLGADRARDDAAERGVNIHALLEAWARSGTPPNPADHPPEQGGYIQALARWVVHADPEPIRVEELVVHPEYGFAGRVDLRARIGGFEVLVDAKTSESGAIWPGAHAQLGLYSDALVACGSRRPERQLVVAFSPNGRFREMEGMGTPALVRAALGWLAELRPVNSACAAGNRRERKLRDAA